MQNKCDRRILLQAIQKFNVVSGEDKGPYYSLLLMVNKWQTLFIILFITDILHNAALL